jgi:hypothetical protein
LVIGGGRGWVFEHQLLSWEIDKQAGVAGEEAEAEESVLSREDGSGMQLGGEVGVGSACEFETGEG